MELKALEQKNGQSSSSSQDPLDQDSPPSSDPPQQSSRTNTSSIDKRTYVPSYLSQGECLAPFLLRPLAFSPVGAINLCFRPFLPLHESPPAPLDFLWQVAAARAMTNEWPRADPNRCPSTWTPPCCTWTSSANQVHPPPPSHLLRLHSFFSDAIITSFNPFDCSVKLNC